MKCGQSRRLFGAYWDDEITQAEREWLEGHFGSCDACRSEYESYSRMLEAVGSLPRVEVQPGLAERALNRARRAAPAPDRVPVRSRPPVWIPLTAAAALVGVLAAGMLQWTGMAPATRVAERSAAPAIDQPAWATATSTEADRATAPSQDAEQAVAMVPDSLFDHSDDVEFILDPVTLRKGRAHTVSDLTTPVVRGETAVITF
jgi:anti-sigma factor RsiW